MKVRQAAGKGLTLWDSAGINKFTTVINNKKSQIKSVKKVWGRRSSAASWVWSGVGVMSCPWWRAVYSVTSDANGLKRLHILTNDASGLLD